MGRKGEKEMHREFCGESCGKVTTWKERNCVGGMNMGFTEIYCESGSLMEIAQDCVH
jgi:hypothetical protein